MNLVEVNKRLQANLSPSWCFAHSAPLPCETCKDVNADPAKYADPNCSICHGTGKYEHWGFMIDGQIRLCKCLPL